MESSLGSSDTKHHTISPYVFVNIWVRSFGVFIKKVWIHNSTHLFKTPFDIKTSLGWKYL